MAPRKVYPHGYEKSPSREDYSSKFLKVVRVRQVESSNLSTLTDKHNVRSPPYPKAVFFLFYSTDNRQSNLAKALTHFTFRVEYRPTCSQFLHCRVHVVRSPLP